MKLLFFALFFSIISSAQTGASGLNIGATAPNFNSVDQNGQKINLKELLKKGPVVLVFYRGEWCPYCNKQLSELADSIQYITAKGARVIAITPETHLNVQKTIQKTRAGYSIISDDSIMIMTNYKVAFMLNEEMTKKYKGYGIDLTERNGTNGNNLPTPAVFVIDKSGKISYRHVDADYTKRTTVAEILKHL